MPWWVRGGNKAVPWRSRGRCTRLTRARRPRPTQAQRRAKADLRARIERQRVEEALAAERRALVRQDEIERGVSSGAISGRSPTRDHTSRSSLGRSFRSSRRSGVKEAAPSARQQGGGRASREAAGREGLLGQLLDAIALIGEVFSGGDADTEAQQTRAQAGARRV